MRQGVGEYVDGSGGVCDWEWGSVWMVVGDCVTRSGGVCVLAYVCLHMYVRICALSSVLGIFTRMCS